MLTRRLIVCLDVKGGRVVKGTQFVNLRDVGDPVELGAAYSERAFHDAFLKEGSIPIALTRAKLLGEPIPDVPARP